MSCNEVHARLIDALLTQRAPSDATLFAHLDSCASCRDAWNDYETMWRELGDLPAARPSPDARARFARRLAAVRLNPALRTGRSMLSWYVGAAAAAVLVAALTGYEVGVHGLTQQVGPAPTEVSMGEPTFLILLHEDSLFRRGEPQVPRAEMVKEYARWADGLSAPGRSSAPRRLHGTLRTGSARRTRRVR